MSSIPLSNQVNVTRNVEIDHGFFGWLCEVAYQYYMYVVPFALVTMFAAPFPEASFLLGMLVMLLASLSHNLRLPVQANHPKAYMAIGSLRGGIKNWFDQQVKRTRDLFVTMDVFSRHVLILGITGCGKTVTIAEKLRQVLSRGSGGMMVDGKGDVDVYLTMVALAHEIGIEDITGIINFSDKEQSHSINPLGYGDADMCSEILGGMLETGGDNSYWAGRGMTFIRAAMTPLVWRRNNEEGFLRIIEFAQANLDRETNDLPIREASARLFNDSKRIERLFVPVDVLLCGDVEAEAREPSDVWQAR